jgi:protein-S-isoprenylcysteine O-methyltransferase Ste14
MHILGQRALGILILLLLALLVIVKRKSTGTILKDIPQGGFGLWFIHIFNLFFILIANPVAAILLIVQQMEYIDITYITINIPWLVISLEICGIILYLFGFILMVWSLLSLGRSYQVGGMSPRTEDKFVINGPYRLIRHPIYAAAICISLGLVLLIQSIAYLIVFCIYLGLIIMLIPFEEKGLLQVYGEQYINYQRQIKKLIPYIY